MAESDPTRTTPSGLTAEEAAGLRRRRSLAMALMVVAALFSGVVIGAMVVTHLPQPPTAPDSPTIQSLRSLLLKSPQSEELKEALRAEDQKARSAYMANRRRQAVGAWMLLVGLTATVICARWYASLDQPTPRPSRDGRISSTTSSRSSALRR